MPITYIGSGTARVNTTATNPCVVAYPTSAELGGSPIQADDAIVLIVTSASLTIPTNPAAFASGALSDSSGGSSPSYLVTLRRATGSESGSVSVTVASTQNQGQMHVFRGVDWTNPIDVASVAGGAGSFRSSGTVAGGAYTMGSITTTKPGVALVYGGAYNSNTLSWTPPTVPAGFTELRDSNASSPGTTHGYLIWSGSGVTGGINLVLAGGTLRGCAGLLALRPITATTVSGAVDLTADSTLTVGAFVEEQAAVALVTVATLTAGAVVTEFAAVPMTAASTLTVAATVTGATVVSGAVALVGTSTLTATAVRQPEAAVSLAAASTLSTAAVRSAVAVVALSGVSTLTTTGLVTEVAAVALTAVSTLTVAGAITGLQPAAVALTATSTFTAAAVREPQAAASLVAASTLVTAAIPVRVATVALTATSTFTATAVRQPEASVSLVAASTLAVTAVRDRPATLALVAASTLTATAVREPQGAVSLTATATFTTAATITPAVFGAVGLVGAATLTVAAVVTGFPYTEPFTGASGPWPVPWETVDTTGGLAEATLSGNRGYLHSLTGADEPVTLLLNHHPLADQEVACEVTMADATDDFAIVLRADPAVTTGVRLTIRRRNTVWTWGLVAGTLASPTVLTGDAVLLPGVDTISLRYQVVGTAVRARFWDPAGAEPGTWQGDTTQSVVSAAGYVGVAGNGAN